MEPKEPRFEIKIETIQKDGTLVIKGVATLTHSLEIEDIHQSFLITLSEEEQKKFLEYAEREVRYMLEEVLIPKAFINHALRNVTLVGYDGEYYLIPFSQLKRFYKLITHKKLLEISKEFQAKGKELEVVEKPIETV